MILFIRASYYPDRLSFYVSHALRLVLNRYPLFATALETPLAPFKITQNRTSRASVNIEGQFQPRSKKFSIEIEPQGRALVSKGQLFSLSVRNLN